MFNNNNDAPIALGFTAKEWVDMLNTDKAVDACKALCYLDGQQEKEMVKVLNDPARGRAQWREKKLAPRFRNVTNMVIQKSGLLFKDSPPVLEIFNADAVTTNEPATLLLNELMGRVEFNEFATNFDRMVRLLKTAMILVQWEPEDKCWVFDALHRGNCEVVINPMTRKVIGMIYRTCDNMYQIWTMDEVIELTQGDNTLGITSREPNPYGVIPMVPFYDTNLPRSGFWVEQDKSLINLNEMVNLHIIDSEYSILWSKMSTLFTNMRPSADSLANHIEVGQVQGSALPRIIPSNQMSPSYMAGPGSAVVLDSQGVDAPFVEYRNPNIELQPLNEVMDSWIKGYALDWSVRLEVAGQGRAQSGFQLIVEETDNLDLRKQRQRMFESGFKRLYRVLAAVLNAGTGVTAFPADAQLYAHFQEPVLPVDVTVQEQVWSLRILEGRATEIDYFQIVQGLSREEAEEKYLEIVEFNKRKAAIAAETADIVEGTETAMEEGKQVEIDGTPDKD